MFKSLPLILFILFVCTPSVSSTLFATFVCDPFKFDDSSSAYHYFLHAELSIRCSLDDPRYNKAYGIAIGMIAIWPAGVSPARSNPRRRSVTTDGPLDMLVNVTAVFL